MLRSTSLRVLRPDGPARGRPTCSPATRSPTSSWPSRVRGRRASTRPGSAARCGASPSTDGSTSLCYAGANLVPVQAGPEAVRGVRRAGPRARAAAAPRSSGRARRRRRLWASWSRPGARPARCATQPAADGRSPVRRRSPPDPLVRRVRPDEIDILVPACVAMFTEEVGVSPLAADGGRVYRAGSPSWSAAGRAFARIEDGRVVFKAEIGAVSSAACQIQGVWVPPDLRGRGLAAPGMAAVAELRSARSRRSSACTSTTSTTPPGRPTAGSASPTSARSCPCCSR